MDGVKKEELTGYRPPTAIEKAEVYRYVEKVRKHDSRVNVFWEIFFSIVSISCLVNFVNYINEGRALEGQAILAVVLGIPLAVVVLLMRKSDRKRRRFLRCIKNGEFQVLDCYSVKLEIDPGFEGSATVGLAYIETVQGQLCSDKFIIDSRSVYDSRDKERIRLILVVQKNYGYYEVLTEKRLKGECV